MQRNPFGQPLSRLGRTLLVILLGGGAALWLSMLQGWPNTPDGAFHVQRVRALSEALAQGVLFPRLFPDFAFGYGYPVLNFYAPAFYYPPALLHLLGVEIITATRLTLLATVLLSLAAMIGLLRALGLRPAAARFGALVFALFPYRIYDYLVRGALPEFAAFLWLPCIAWSMLAVARARSRERSGAAVLVAGLCWAGLILTHNLTALMAASACAVTVATVVVTQAAQGKRSETGAPLLRLMWAFALGLLLSAWYWAPALLETRYVALGQDATTGYTNHFAQWGNLLEWRVPYIYPTAADPTVPLPAWLVIPALGVILILFQRRKGVSGAVILKTAAVTTTGLLLVTFWLTTASSAWVWRVFAPLLSRLQFPWRWQAILALAVAVALALLLQPLLKGRSRIVVRIVTLAGTIFVTTYTLAAAPWANGATIPDVTRAAMWAFDAAQGQVGATWTAEFLPRWVTEQRWAIGREPSDGAPSAALPVDARATLVNDGYLHAAYQVRSPTGMELRFNRFYYPAWAISVDGARMAKQPVGNLGLLAAPIPSGDRTVALRWAATPAVWLGRVLTALGWLLGLWYIWHLRAWRMAALVGWLAVGLLLLAGSSGITARSLPVQAADADFGPVQLAGMAAVPTRAGADAALAFHWLVQEQSGDLVTFIHLLAPDGALLAQVDAPLAGDYAPADRLAPGTLVRIEQRLHVPHTVAPGVYALRVGLYPAGQPDAPLQPVGSDTPYSTALRLEVLP